MYELILNAIDRILLHEFNSPGEPYYKPKFVFQDPPHVTFPVEERRYIDSKDYVKNATSKKYATYFDKEYCGNLANRQYYYFDLRELATKYYINVTTRQISGLLWDIDNKTFIGLEKYSANRNKHVILETKWVTENFEAPFIKLVKEKASTDSKRFVKLPIGKGRPLQNPPKQINNTPRIAYPQYGLDTCVFSSLSSALYYLQFEDVALQIDDLKS